MNVKSLLVQAILFTLVVVAGLWLGAWILSIPTSSASGALAPLAFQSPIGDPELHVAKTVNNDSPEPGELIEYTLTYSVTSTSGHPNPRAYDVRLYDFLPAGAEYVTSNPSAYYEDGTVLFTDTSVGLTDETVIVFARVQEGYEQLYNYALVAADGVTPTHDSLLTAVDPAPPLNLSKTSDPVVLINSELVYTIQCENPGYTAATDVTIMDILPAGVSFVGASPPPDEITLPVLSWSLGDLGSGDSSTIVVTATAPVSPSVITNTAIVGSQRGMTYTLFATQVISEGSILRVTKQGSAAEVDVEDELVYTLQYENIGNQPAIGTRLTDTLPANVTVTGVYSTGGTLVSSSPLVFDLGTVSPGDPPEKVVITVTVTGGRGETLHNVADITAPGSYPGHAELDTDVRLALLCLPIVTKVF